MAAQPGDGGRHGYPVTASALVGELAGYAYLPWLIIAGYPAMSLGMLVYILFRLPGAEGVRPART